MLTKAQSTQQTDEAAHKREIAKPTAQGPVTQGQQRNSTLQRAAMDPQTANPSAILALQRAAGNRAVTRLVQAKLMVGPAGDQYEQEADRVAEQVMSMPTPTKDEGGRRKAEGSRGSVQRQAPQEEEEVQTKPLAASITRLVQRQATPEEEEVQTKRLVQRQETPEEEEVQTKPLVQRQATPEKEEVQTKRLMQRQATPEEEEVQTKRLVQRQATPEEEEVQTKRMVQRQEMPEEEEVQTKLLVQRRGDGGFEAGSEMESRLAAHQGAGSPLPDETRAYMEPRFGADFSGVRVHTGSEAAQLNRQISAQAFTHGQDIYLSEDKYDPGSEAGKQLLAHELTHVVQQTGSGQS